MKTSDIKILVVDDDQMMLETLSDLFKSFQFDVDTATGGNEAWKLFQEKPYNIVISDIRMPDGDGLELAQKIKQHSPEKTSILFISGFSETVNEEIYHLGVEGVFTKPFNSHAVKNAIKSCFLPAEVKWAQPIETNKAIEIQNKGKDIAELENQKTIVFGRGGFFMSYTYSMPSKGSLVSFEIELIDPIKIVFKGTGVIKWIQSHSKPNAPAGLGIEILYMPPGLAKVYHKLFGNRVSYIPSPRKLSQTN